MSIDLTRNQSFNIKGNRLKADSPTSLSFQKKMHRKWPVRWMDFIGTSKTSLHKVIKTSNNIATLESSKILGDEQLSKETKLQKMEALEGNLKTLEEIREKCKKKMIFKVLPVFYCADSKTMIFELSKQTISLLQEEPEETSSESEDASYYSCEELESESSDESIYYSGDEIWEDDYTNLLSSSEKREDEFDLVPLKDDDPKGLVFEALLQHVGPDVATVMHLMLPKGIKSWDLDEQNHFKLELEKPVKGQLRGVVFSVSDIITGVLDSKNSDIKIDEGCITGTFMITGSLLSIKDTGNDCLLATGGRTIGTGYLSKQITKSLSGSFTMAQDLLTNLEWEN